MMPLLIWQEHMVCQVNLGSILIQNRNLRDLSGLFDSLGTKIILGAKFRDVSGHGSAFTASCCQVSHGYVGVTEIGYFRVFQTYQFHEYRFQSVFLRWSLLPIHYPLPTSTMQREISSCSEQIALCHK